MGSKPKAPKPTAFEQDLERRQRSELDKLTREENERLKAIKRQSRGRRTLLGTSELGLMPGFGGAVRGRAGGGRGGGIMGPGGGGGGGSSGGGGIMGGGRGGGVGPGMAIP